MKIPFIPDPMRRFVPTPYDWRVGAARIESNNLDVALMLRHAMRTAAWAERVDHARIVMDWVGEQDGAEILIEAGPVRTLLRGGGTVLFYDAKSRELLGFVAPEVGAEELVERCVPSLLGVESIEP